jgi:hypothetical protein
LWWPSSQQNDCLSRPICTPTSSNVTSEDKTVGVTQVTSTDEIDFIRCEIEAYHHVWRCGKSFDTGYAAGMYSEVWEVSEEESNEMIIAHKYTLRTDQGKIELMLPVTGDLHYSYVSRGSISNEGSCTPGVAFSLGDKTYDRPVQNTRLQFKYSRGTARLNYEDQKILFPNGMFCKYLEKTCYLSDYGSIYWKIKEPKCPNEEQKSLVYEGLGNIIIIVSR